MSKHHIRALLGVAVNTLLKLEGSRNRLSVPMDFGADDEYWFEPNTTGFDGSRRLSAVKAYQTMGATGGFGLRIRSVSQLVNPKKGYSFQLGGAPADNLKAWVPGMAGNAYVEFRTATNQSLDGLHEVDGTTNGLFIYQAEGVIHRYRLPTADACQMVLAFTSERNQRIAKRCFQDSWDGSLPSDLVLAANNSVRQASFRENLPWEFAPLG